MDGLEGVLDAPELDAGVESAEIETEVPEEGAEAVEGAESPEQPLEEANPSNPYTTQFSREMRTALKQWEQANPAAAKFAKQARDNHARMFALQQLEPKGIDGVREKYSLLDSLIHGEATGPDALTAMRDDLAGMQEIDSKIASGDPTALEKFGPEFNEGLTKIAPALLSRIQQSNPQAHEAIMLPEHVKFIANSSLLKDFNDIVDVINAKDDPRFDEATKLKFTIQKLASMGTFLNSLDEKSRTLATAATQAGPKTDPLTEQRTQFEQEQQKFHWDTKIAPQASSHENKTFDSLFDPYQKRLKLDAAAKEDLRQAYKSALNRAGQKDPDFMRQMKIYRSQKNPDPAIVANYVKNAINKHSKAAMESLISARYGAFLKAAPRPTPPAAGKPAANRGPVAPNVEVRTVKPPMHEIDHRNTPVAWLAMKQYRLTNGKVVKVVTQ